MSASQPRVFIAAAILVAALVSPDAGATVVRANFNIDGAQEVPPSGSAGTGTGKISLDTVSGLLTWRVSYGGLSGAATAAHFHGPAAPGVNAGVQVNIGTANPAIGSTTLNATQRADLLAGLWYVNVHTAAFPGGEVRGQVAPITGPILHSTFPIDASQEVPTNGSPATGVGRIAFETATNTLRWSISYGGLLGSPTAAHFHGPAAPGVNAGVQVNIGVAANPAVGSAVLNATQAADLLAGLWYANVHSSMFPGGEIRGQVSPIDGPVVLNEIFYDSDGADDGNAFYELAGPAGANIGGWRLVSIEGGAAASCGQVNGASDIAIPDGTTIGADGLYVIADTAGGVTNVVTPVGHNGGAPDLLSASADFENGTDVVQLIDALGGLADVCAYEDPAQALCSDSDVVGNDMLEFQSALDFAFGGVSLTRWPTGSDTDNNFEDFVPNRAPSPGAHGEPRALVFVGPGTISLTAGGTVDYDIYTCRPNTQYLLLAFITQPTSQTLAGLAFDPVTNIFINLTITPNPIVVNFTGNLDHLGRATATLAIPAGIATIGVSVPVFFAAIAPVDATAIVTNDVSTTIAP